jgi:hypothetical protein
MHGYFGDLISRSSGGVKSKAGLLLGRYYCARAKNERAGQKDGFVSKPCQQRRQRAPGGSSASSPGPTPRKAGWFLHLWSL